jgi:hypothetical protein
MKSVKKYNKRRCSRKTRKLRRKYIRGGGGGPNQGFNNEDTNFDISYISGDTNNSDTNNSMSENEISTTSTHFLMNNQEYQTKVLKTLCSESGVCLDFGNNRQLITDFFDNFDFDFSMEGKRIGKPSSNGAVIEIPFIKNNFKAYAALKIATVSSADNLMYEFIVGKKFINQYINVFPCFCETYRFLSFYDLKVHFNLTKLLYDNKNIKINNYMFNVNTTDISDYKDICEQNELFAVLIQHFNGFRTMYDDLKDNNFSHVERECARLFYQGYFALDYMQSFFTHYDLHLGNFGYYKPYNNKYIIMIYHSDDGKEYRFPTLYITKLIDYGRSHFSNNETNTFKIMNEVCKYQNKYLRMGCCNDDFGLSIVAGFPNEKPNSVRSSFYWVNPLYKNASHDLRAIANYYSSFKNYMKLGNIKYLEQYGTPEDISTPYDPSTRSIANVGDLRKNLEQIIEEDTQNGVYKKIEDEYIQNGLRKAGEMHVYRDGRPYEWIAEK